MKVLPALTFMELKLFLREPAAVIVAVLLPPGMVAVFGAIFDPQPGGDPIASYFPAMALAVGLSQLALNMMPTALVGYREKHVLRRLSATPVHPVRLLAAQLLVSMIVAVTAAVTVVAVGWLAFGFGPPRHVPGFLLAFVLGTLALLAVGLFVAAVAPSARAATGLGILLFFANMLTGGVFTPAETMPATLVKIGGYTPLGAMMTAVRDSWSGTFPQPTQLLVLAAVTVVFGLAAAKLFRWD